MNIVQVSGGELRIPADKGGGIEAFILSISKQLSKMGHNVTILDRKYAQADPPIECIDGVNIVRLSVWRFPRFNSTISYILNQLTFAFQVQKYLRNTKDTDVIHVHEALGGFVLALISKSLRSKLFYASHSSRRTKDSLGFLDRAAFIFENQLAKRVRRVTIENETMRAKLVKEAKVKPEDAVFIPLGVDTDKFTPFVKLGDIRQRYGLEEKTAILFVGRIRADKGVDYLVKAANIVVNEFGNNIAHFLLVGPVEQFGSGEREHSVYLAKILRLIQDCRLRENVKLTGTVLIDDLRRLYAACDVVVVPSIVDLGPQVTLEAMACGKPVIGTTVGTMPMQIENGRSGFLVEPANERQLAEKIKYFIDNPAEAKAMGAYGRRLAEKKFSSDKIAEKLLQVYQLD